MILKDISYYLASKQLAFITALLLQLAVHQINAQVNDTTTIFIPAGSFEMGCNYEDPELPCLPSTYPAHTVHLDAFKIDKYPVTYRRYNKCVDAGICTDLYAGAGCNAGMPWNSDHPVNCVDFNQAQTFCEWEGKRLLTEAEWEKAARGADGRIFPWGNEHANCDLAVMNDQPFVDGVMGPGCGSGTTQPVGSKPNGASPYGVMDMSGQLWEWTQDWYSDTYFQDSPSNNPQGPATGDYKVLKGGGDWGMRHPAEVVANIRFNYAPLGQGYLVGFRCGKNATTTDVQEGKALKFKIFPNPTSNEVYVKGENINSIELIDLSGKLLKTTGEINTSSFAINMNAYPEGTYFIKVQSANHAETQKIINQK